MLMPADWVKPDSLSAENIIGLVVETIGDSDVKVAWLSNTRGLWKNWESASDLTRVEAPTLDYLQHDILAVAEPITPYGYES